MLYPNRQIKEGETDTAIVKFVQNQLTTLGYGTFNGTGLFGPKTTYAVKLFQATHKDQHGNPLVVDGKIGAITWWALFGEETIVVNADGANTLLSKVIEIAQTQVGVMEAPPGSNGGLQVDQYLASVGLPTGNYWCASFVYWCFENAAKELNKKNPLIKTGGCVDHWNRTKGKKILPVDAKNNPSLVKPGQIFILNFGGGQGHTGIVKKVEGGFLHTIEGNSNNDGSRNGIGVFALTTRKITSINGGFIEYK